MDTKYGMLVEHGRDDYTVIPLCREGATPDEVMKAALECIVERALDENGDISFEIVEITSATKHNTRDHQAFFEAKYAAHSEQVKAAEARREQQEYERLKAKFGK